MMVRFLHGVADNLSGHRALVLLIAWACGSSCVGEAQKNHLTETEVRQQMFAYYAGWVGVNAPSLGPHVRDRVGGAALAIENYRGKPVLLYSFDAGDFVSGPTMQELTAELVALRTLRTTIGNKYSVIGFTYGPIFFLPQVSVPKELEGLTAFPIVNLATVDLPEPYDLLSRWPSGIVIDSNGVIVSVFPRTMRDSLFREAFETPVWDEGVRRPPKPLPAEVKTFSSRVFWNLLVYVSDLPAGVALSKTQMVRSRVHAEGDVPEDRILSVKQAEGRTLRQAVRKGAPVRAADLTSPPPVSSSTR